MADNGGMLRLLVSSGASGGGGEEGEEVGAPQGRLTLTSGVPRLTSTVLAAGTIYYEPDVGDFFPLFDGSSTWTMTQFTAMSQALSDATKSPAAALAHQCFDMFGWDDGGTKRVTRGPAWIFTQTFTVTIASPAVVSATAHGLVAGNTVRFTTTGALPTGLTAGTVYFVIKATADTFQVSATLGGAAINTSGTQSGVHTCTDSNRRRGTGAGTSEVTLTASGRRVNTNAITNGPAASRGVRLGSIRTDGNSQCNMIFGGAGAAGGEANRFDVWNEYNQIPLTMANFDNSNSWAAAANSGGDRIGLKNNNVNNGASFIIGEADRGLVHAMNIGLGGSNNGGTSSVMMCLNPLDTSLDTIVTSELIGSRPGRGHGDFAFASASLGVAMYHGHPGLGHNQLFAAERNESGGTYYGDNNFPAWVKNELQVTVWC
jgi:hypothetical protein